MLCHTGHVCNTENINGAKYQTQLYFIAPEHNTGKNRKIRFLSNKPGGAVHVSLIAQDVHLAFSHIMSTIRRFSIARRFPYPQSINQSTTSSFI